MRRNQVAKLSQNSELGCGWIGVSFFHLCRVTELKSHSNHFFSWFNQDFYGMAVYRELGQRRFNPRVHTAKIMALSEVYGPDKVARAIEDAFNFAAFSSDYGVSVFRAGDPGFASCDSNRRAAPALADLGSTAGRKVRSSGARSGEFCVAEETG